MKTEKFLREYKPIKSERTRKSYRGFLNHFALHLHERDLTPERVHPADIKNFAEWVKNRFNPKTKRPGLSDAAVQSHLAAVSSYYRWARCRNPKLRNPVESFKYRRREPRKTRNLISRESVQVMSDQGGSELGNLVVKLFRGSGLRLSELVSLNRRDVKIDRKGNQPRVSVKVKGKGGKFRIAPIGATAATALISYLDRRGDDGVAALILSTRNRRISRRTVQRLVQAAAAKLGAHSHPHELRHRFTTDAIENGLPDKQVRKHLGQGSLEHTYRYIHLTEEGVEREFQLSMRKIDQQLADTCQQWPATGRVKGDKAA